MFSAEKLLGGLVQEALSSSLGVSSRSSRRRSHRGSNSLERAVGMGLVGLAVGAFEHFTKQAQAVPAQPAGSVVPPSAPPPTPSAAPPPPPPPIGSAGGPASAPAVILIRAMFAAAASDGVIDDRERSRIFERMSTVELSGDEKAFLEREMAQPCSLFQLLEEVDRAHADQSVREQVYLVSLIAIEDPSDAEREYLQGLCEGLGLSAEQVTKITQNVG